NHTAIDEHHRHAVSAMQPDNEPAHHDVAGDPDALHDYPEARIVRPVPIPREAEPFVAPHEPGAGQDTLQRRERGEEEHLREEPGDDGAWGYERIGAEVFQGANDDRRENLQAVPGNRSAALILLAQITEQGVVVLRGHEAFEESAGELRRLAERHAIS